MTQRAGLVSFRLVMEGRRPLYGHPRCEGVALEAEQVHAGTPQHPRIRRAVSGMTCGTALGLHRGMLEGERPGLRLVAAATHLFLRDRGAQFALEIAAMLVMAVSAPHQLLFHSMMEGFAEFCLSLGVALLAKLRLRGT